VRLARGHEDHAGPGLSRPGNGSKAFGKGPARDGDDVGQIAIELTVHALPERARAHRPNVGVVVSEGSDDVGGFRVAAEELFEIRAVHPRIDPQVVELRPRGAVAGSVIVRNLLREKRDAVEFQRERGIAGQRGVGARAASDRNAVSKPCDSRLSRALFLLSRASSIRTPI